MNRIILIPGQKGTTSGFKATVVRHYFENMYEVQLRSGLKCIDASEFIPEDKKAIRKS